MLLKLLLYISKQTFMQIVVWEANLRLRLVGNFESMNEELVMNDMNVELDPRDLEVGME